MGRLGVELGMMVALLWGSADILATLAARRVGTFKTTFVSQSSGLIALLAFGAIACWGWHLSFTLPALALSALIGMFTGLCAALGYFAFYRALEIGPIALVSPLTSTSSIFTLTLSILILNEQVTLGHMGLVIIIILGILLASTSVAEFRTLRQKPGYSLWSQGIRWAVIATLAFGAMDFGIGASASIAGWFLPVVWTRLFSLVFLTLTSCWNDRRRQFRTQARDSASLHRQGSGLSLPGLESLHHMRNLLSKNGPGVLLAVAAGMLENAAVLMFSLDTRIATTGITSAIASGYALVVMAFGMIVYRERLAKNQLFGIIMFTSGLILLAV